MWTLLPWIHCGKHHVRVWRSADGRFVKWRILMEENRMKHLLSPWRSAASMSTSSAPEACWGLMGVGGDGGWWGGPVGVKRPWQALMQLSGVLVQRCAPPRSVSVTAEIIRLLNEPQRWGAAPGERLSPRQHEPWFAVPLISPGRSRPICPRQQMKL